LLSFFFGTKSNLQAKVNLTRNVKISNEVKLLWEVGNNFKTSSWNLPVVPWSYPLAVERCFQFLIILNWLLERMDTLPLFSSKSGMCFNFQLCFWRYFPSVLPNVAKVSKELGFHFNHVLGDSPILVQAGAVEIANLLLQMVYEFWHRIFDHVHTIWTLLKLR